MEIRYEVVPVPVSEARKTGKWERRVYYVCEGRKRVGPYANIRDAQLAMSRAEEAVRRILLRAAEIRNQQDNAVARAEEIYVPPATI